METKEIMVKCVLDAWNSRIEAANKVFDSLSDDDLQKNIYLLNQTGNCHKN